MEGLTPAMQLRLDQWRKNTLSVESAKIFKSPGNFVSRSRDYGDDISDYEKKERDMWRRNDEFKGK